MPVFARRRATQGGRDLTATERDGVPRHFEAVAEALAGGHDPAGACSVAGATLAADGASLGEALSALASTCAAFGTGEPTFAATQALSLAWSEETLAFVNDVSCEDPLTGLASAAHLRARLAEVYRETASAGTTPRTTHALLVVDLSSPGDSPLGVVAPTRDPFVQALHLAAAAELVRDALGGGGTLARVGSDQLVALATREPRLGATVVGLRSTLQRARVSPRPRLWIEGLPGSLDAAVEVVATLSMR